LPDASNGAAPIENQKSKASATARALLEAFRWMLLTRTLEENSLSIGAYLITGGVYIGKGQEA
jgi:TPP-dependent pyruvate/acetoin dehydrogenase alpha subunit